MQAMDPIVQEWEQSSEMHCKAIKRILEDPALTWMGKYRKVAKYMDDQEWLDICAAEAKMLIPLNPGVTRSEPAASPMKDNRTELAVAAMKPLDQGSHVVGAGSSSSSRWPAGGVQCTLPESQVSSQEKLKLDMIAANKAKALAARDAKKAAACRERDLQIAQNMQWMGAACCICDSQFTRSQRIRFECMAVFQSSVCTQSDLGVNSNCLMLLL